MKALILSLFITFTVAIPAYSMDSYTLKQALHQVENTQIDFLVVSQIREAISKITDTSPGLSTMPLEKVAALAEAVYKASAVSGADWRLILAISYVESRICNDRWLKGDKKPGTTGRRLFDYWAIGCMQVNLKWWGKAVASAGLSQQDLLNYEKGILVGALILKYKVDIYGWRLGIIRYNGFGPDAVAYANRVLEVYNKIV